MSNPWEEISLNDYEEHMRLDSVKQLQALDSFMEEQLSTYPVDTAMILGVAGGNGLEHIRPEKYKTVYGVDINKEYLIAASERYKNISNILKLLQLDLTTDTNKLPRVQLIIAERLF